MLDLLSSMLHCSAVQCVAVRCYVLQRVAVCCSVLQCVAVCGGVLQCDAVCCSVILCVAVCCSVLQCVTVCGSVWQCVAVCGSAWQCVAVDEYWQCRSVVWYCVLSFRRTYICVDRNMHICNITHLCITHSYRGRGNLKRVWG